MGNWLQVVVNTEVYLDEFEELKEITVESNYSTLSSIAPSC